MAKVLEKPSSDDRAFLHAVKRSNARCRGAVVTHPTVDFVRQYPAVELSSPSRRLVRGPRIGITPPVGLLGELITIKRVRSLTRARKTSRSNEKPFSSLSGIGTGTPPATLIIAS